MVLMVVAYFLSMSGWRRWHDGRVTTTIRKKTPSKGSALKYNNNSMDRYYGVQRQQQSPSSRALSSYGMVWSGMVYRRSASQPPQAMKIRKKHLD